MLSAGNPMNNPTQDKDEVTTPIFDSIESESIHVQADVIDEHKEHEHIEKHKFVGRSREREQILKATAPRKGIEPPADVRRWTEVLGLDCDNFTSEEVYKSWRKQMASPSVHPDLGGEVEVAIELNTAKDSLIKWLDSFAPKLGKQFSHLAK